MFETGRKSPWDFLPKSLQPAARRNGPPMVGNSHICGLSGIFSDVQAAGENDSDLFAACGRQTLRGYLKYEKNTGAKAPACFCAENRQNRDLVI